MSHVCVGVASTTIVLLTETYGVFTTTTFGIVTGDNSVKISVTSDSV